MNILALIRKRALKIACSDGIRKRPDTISMPLRGGQCWENSTRMLPFLHVSTETETPSCAPPRWGALQPEAEQRSKGVALWPTTPSPRGHRCGVHTPLLLPWGLALTDTWAGPLPLLWTTEPWPQQLPPSSQNTGNRHTSNTCASCVHQNPVSSW